MSYTFVRWLREGVAAALDDAVLESPSGPRAQLTVDVEIGGTGISNQIASTKVAVLGPGDAVGIDPRQVVRTFPVAGTVDFEPTYFAHVEFDRPDLPWLFSPVPPVSAPDATPTGWSAPPLRKQHTVTPWLCLAVVPRRDGVTLEAALPLPRLKIATGAGAELPLLDEAHAWAHVQVTGDTSNGVAAVASGRPEAIVSRLVCPRRLVPGQAYFACVVPTFKAGREAGLGLPITATAPNEPAWSSGDAQVELPVYFSWEFGTGGEGDFASLVRRLEPRASLPGVGTRKLDVTSPGFGLKNRTAATVVDLGGALRVTAGADPPVDKSLAADLPPLLDQADAVGPPIYGRWHAAVTAVSKPLPAKLGWVDALNLDPRYRVAAGLGTTVVQERQEDLMAAAWEQLGEILRANQLLRQAQLAAAASERVVARHLTPLPDFAFLSLVGPALGRVSVGQRRTARRTARESCLPLLALSGTFRRVARARGPLERRFARRARTGIPDKLPKPAIEAEGLLADLAAGRLAVPAQMLPAGTVTVVPVRVRPELGRRPPRGGPATDGIPSDVQAAVSTLVGRAAAPACKALGGAALAGAIRGAIAPDAAVGARVRAQITLPTGLAISKRLDPIMATPEIPTPMIGPLRERGQDWLLPGLSEIPPNTVAIVEPDAAFIESYMVGLNHELARELLWRGYPTDQRGTSFSRFWDRRGAVPTATAPVPDRDIEPIHTWDVAGALGSNLASNGRYLIVLLVRGELLQRYPRATVYMQRSRWKRDAQGSIVVEDGLAVREPVKLSSAASWEADARFPSFSGRVGGDLTFLGFPLSRTEVRGRSRRNVPDDPAQSGNPGWYVVFQEQPTEPRFGLDATGSATLRSWEDLGWSNVSTTGAQGAGFLKVGDTSNLQRLAELRLAPAWDGRAESLAAILLKRAFRLYVHASDLVPQ